MQNQANNDTIQSVLTDDLFPAVNHVSDVKQVLEYMQDVAQAVSEEQLRAAILLEEMGNNKRLHGDNNPYLWMVDRLIGKVDKKGQHQIGYWKKVVAHTSVYLDTLQELIPKPPRPIVMAPKGYKE